MIQRLDLPELRNLAYLPEITLGVYMAMPEEICNQIEVVDGWMVRAECPQPSHQTIQFNFVFALNDAANSCDAGNRERYRTIHNTDVLISASTATISGKRSRFAAGTSTRSIRLIPSG